MKIFITTPSFARHGGIRIIMEWANRLTAWHDVFLHSLEGGKPDWFELNRAVRITGASMKGMDCLIITSPHAIDFQDREDRPEKVFIFMQMVEHLFRPDDVKWKQQCFKFYRSPHPMFHGSRWGYEFCKQIGRTGREHYIPNGVNTADFPFSYQKKDGRAILVEGWESTNAAKDCMKIGPQVAARLKSDGFHIIAYGITPLKTMPGVPNEYYLKPSLTKINRLYERATILLKATKFDARALAPLEAATKGTVTARAIIQGDDDLIHGWNCEKVGYENEALYQAAKKLLNWPGYREKLSYNLQADIRRNSWDSIMEKVNSILCG